MLKKITNRKKNSNRIERASWTSTKYGSPKFGTIHGHLWDTQETSRFIYILDIGHEKDNWI